MLEIQSDLRSSVQGLDARCHQLSWIYPYPYTPPSPFFQAVFFFSIQILYWMTTFDIDAM